MVRPSGMYGGEKGIRETLRTLGSRCEYNVKVVLINIVRVIGWINLALDKEQRLALLHTVTNLTNSIQCGVCVCVCSFCNAAHTLCECGRRT
jgi:hypothetical protein